MHLGFVGSFRCLGFLGCIESLGRLGFLGLRDLR